MLVNIWLFSAVVPHIETVSDCIPVCSFSLKMAALYQNSKHLEAKENEDTCILFGEIFEVFCGSNCIQL